LFHGGFIQDIIAEINDVIRAKTIVDKECNSMISEYGDIISELLIAQVWKMVHHMFAQYPLNI
jgi:hypothetical protein